MIHECPKNGVALQNQLLSGVAFGTLPFLFRSLLWQGIQPPSPPISETWSNGPNEVRSLNQRLRLFQYRSQALWWLHTSRTFSVALLSAGKGEGAVQQKEKPRLPCWLLLQPGRRRRHERKRGGEKEGEGKQQCGLQSRVEVQSDPQKRPGVRSWSTLFTAFALDFFSFSLSRMMRKPADSCRKVGWSCDFFLVFWSIFSFLYLGIAKRLNLVCSLLVWTLSLMECVENWSGFVLK